MTCPKLKGVVPWSHHRDELMLQPEFESGCFAFAVREGLRWVIECPQRATAKLASSLAKDCQREGKRGKPRFQSHIKPGGDAMQKETCKVADLGGDPI